MNIHQEIRILNTSVELITNYVNYAICSFPDDRTKIIKTVLPKDDTAKKYFFILLLELIAGVNKELVPEKDNCDNLLTLLHKIANTPQLAVNPIHTTALKKSVERFENWINNEFSYSIYSANIGQEVKIKLTRKDALYLIGNRCKHSLTRSNAILNKIIKIYNQSGVSLATDTRVLILEDIDTWLFDDFGGYHFTKICELSADVYRGIVQYIQPVYEQALVMDDSIEYSYNIPDEVTEEASKFEYCELLNAVRSPFISQIKTWEHLLEKY